MDNIPTWPLKGALGYISPNSRKPLSGMHFSAHIWARFPKCSFQNYKRKSHISYFVEKDKPQQERREICFSVEPSSTLRSCLYIANWSASCQLGFLSLLRLIDTCFIQFQWLLWTKTLEDFFSLVLKAPISSKPLHCEGCLEWLRNTHCVDSPLI